MGEADQTYLKPRPLASAALSSHVPSHASPLVPSLVFSLVFSLGACLMMLCLGCNSASPSATDLQVNLAFAPSPPLVGDVNVSLTLSDADGAPVAGATVQLEGNMNHAGMKPSFADLAEVEPGNYAGTLEFTMGGDWFILVTGKTADGRSIEYTIDVPGVKPR